MRGRQTITLAICLLVLLLNPSFSQNDTKTTLIGNPNDHETANNIVADNAGNTYVGGYQYIEALVVKQSASHAILWSKKFSFPTYHIASIEFMDLVGDTLFGCGRFITQTNTAYGVFYFKLNAQTGAVYWVKHELGSFGYLSCMRYSNGKFILVGGIDDLNTLILGGKVMAVSSQTGNVLWQTPMLKYPIASIDPGGGWQFSSKFLHATEVSNGKLYITGFSSIYAPSVYHEVSLPLLIGITETGNIFMEKHLALPFDPAGYNQFEGRKIHLDANQDLVFSCIDGGLLTDDAILLKCDLNGNPVFCKYYNIHDGAAQNAFLNLTSFNETTNSYTLFGGATDNNYMGLYAMKVAKNGSFQKCIKIFKPNTGIYSSFIRPFGYGNSVFRNGLNYFVTNEVTTSNPNYADINQIILDEELSTSEDCSELAEWNVTTTDVPFSTGAVTRVSIPQTLVLQSNYIEEPVPFADYCVNISLNLSQNLGCSQATITANTSGFTDPVFYWSNGADSSLNSQLVTTNDTLIVRVLDTKCCELIDTIVPVLTTSSFTVNLPNDTTICLQPGNSFPLTPTVSGPVGTPQYAWSDGSTGTSMNVTQSGTYWVEISDNCLTLRDSITIVVNALPVIGNTGNVAICEGAFPTTISPTVSAGASVLWDDGTTTVNRTVNGPGTYTISATNTCGTVNASISVSQTDLPAVQLISSIDTCIQNGTSITLSPVFTGATTVDWSDGSSGNQLAVFVSGMYTVLASNTCGTDSASVSVTIHHFPELYLPARLDTCFEIGTGFSYTAPGSAGSYQWSSGSNTATEWISQEGMYTVTLTNQCGSVTDSMEVHRLAEVDLYFPEDSIRACSRQLEVSRLQIETNFNLEILAPYHGTVDAYLSESGWYTIHAFNGCWHQWDSIYVDLQDAYFYLPNSFTPNGDSHNGVFRFEGDEVVIREVRIFNRWGEEIFAESGAFTGWDGTYQGEMCPDGMYAVHLVYEDCFGIPTEFNGHVNLIR